MALEPSEELISETVALINRLLEGNLSEEGVARLSELLCTHRELAKLYVRYMHLHRLLPRFVAAQDLILSDDDLSVTMILPALVEDDMAPVSADLLAAEGIEFPHIFYPPKVEQRGWKPWRWAAVIVLPLLSATLVYVATRGTPPKPLITIANAPAATQPDNVHIATSETVHPPFVIKLSPATLTDTIAAIWNSKAPDTGVHLPFAAMNLQSGLARLQFDNGVVAIVHGPAVFEVKSDMNLDLKSGSVSVEVSPNAHEFAVQTPTAKVVDLGTEFGVVTAEKTGTHVEVFQGKVAASALEAQTGASPQLLTLNQAAEIAPGASSVAVAPLQRQEFVRAKEFTIIQRRNESKFNHWLAYSYQLRHDPQLALYYPFEASSNADSIPNAALASFTRFDLSLSTQRPQPPQVGQGRWPEKSAIVFASSRHQRLSLPECPLSTTGKLTVAAWVNADSRPSWATIAKSRGDSVTGQFSLGIWSTDGDLVARVCQADGTDVTIREGKQSPIPVGKWFFAAMVVDGQTLKIYRDGVEVASTPCTDVTTTPVIHSFSIGFQPTNDGVSTRKQTEAYWNGSMDELAFFHRPLSALELKTMYEAGKPD